MEIRVDAPVTNERVITNSSSPSQELGVAHFSVGSEARRPKNQSELQHCRYLSHPNQIGLDEEKTADASE